LQYGRYIPCVKHTMRRYLAFGFFGAVYFEVDGTKI